MEFYGKLKKHRDFIYSRNLCIDERLLLEKWYSRCRDSNSLLPFLNTNGVNNKTWLFVLVLDHKVMIGMTSNSEDLSGRKYPFTLFNVVSRENLFDQCSEVVRFYLQRINQFKTLIKNGRLDEIDKFIVNSDSLNSDTELQAIEFIRSIDIKPDYRNHITDSNNVIRSFWIDVNTNFYISYENFLTCNLYNRIYG